MGSDNRPFGLIAHATVGFFIPIAMRSAGFHTDPTPWWLLPVLIPGCLGALWEFWLQDPVTWLIQKRRTGGPNALDWILFPTGGFIGGLLVHVLGG